MNTSEKVRGLLKFCHVQLTARVTDGVVSSVSMIQELTGIEVRSVEGCYSLYW